MLALKNFHGCAAIIVVWSVCVSAAVGCSTHTTYGLPAGNVSSRTARRSIRLDHWVRGSVDHCWEIKTLYQVVVIKFSRFDGEPCCDKLRIYEGSIPSDSAERFRLSHPDVTQSEFWLAGYKPTLVRFTSSSSFQRTQFEFGYTTKETFSIPAISGRKHNGYSSAEVIRAMKGSRSSHPGYGASNYSNNILHAWSIGAAQNQRVTVRFTSFSTELNYDWLTIFPGILPNVSGHSVLRLTGSLNRSEISRDYRFIGPVTLVFQTDDSNVESGFIFQFNVSNYIEPIVHQLSLKLLYRFATHGLVNVAEPGQSTLERRSRDAVPVDSEGAHFTRHRDSFLTAQTPGFENVINKCNEYSLFIRAKHPMNINAMYAVFRACTGSSRFRAPNGHEFLMYLNGKTLLDNAFWSTDKTSYCSSTSNHLASSAATSMVSAGVTFNRDRHGSFFFNGTMQPALLYSASEYYTEQSAKSLYQCLHLGGDPTSSEYSVQGSMSCFALSTRILTHAEFLQLASWCSIK